MDYTVEMLVKGDPAVVDYYRRAVEHWKEIWSRPESRNLDDLATIVEDEEAWFESHCGTPQLGREIMVVSGLGMLYSPEAGFNGTIDQARLLSNAFQLGGCSLETSVLASRLEKSYRLFEGQMA